MAVVGGPVESAILKGRRFESDGESTCKITLSGTKNEVKPNGNGSNRLSKKRKVGGIEGLKLVCDNATGDFEYLQELNDTLEFFPAQVTLVDGTIYNCFAQIIDDVQLDTEDSTCEIKLSGNVEKL